MGVHVEVRRTLRDRLVAGAMLIAPLAACGDEVDDSDPPQLLSGQFEDQTHLVLQFSEPLAPVEGVDPEKFRLSLAISRGYFTDYYDLSVHFDGSPYEELGDDSGRWLRHQQTRVTSLERLADPSQLELEISDEIDHAGACEAIAAAETEAGLFVHYTDFRTPNVADPAGNALEDIASHWVMGNTMASVGGDLEELDSAPAIPCLAKP